MGSILGPLILFKLPYDCCLVGVLWLSEALPALRSPGAFGSCTLLHAEGGNARFISVFVCTGPVLKPVKLGIPEAHDSPTRLKQRLAVV